MNGSEWKASLRGEGEEGGEHQLRAAAQYLAAFGYLPREAAYPYRDLSLFGSVSDLEESTGSSLVQVALLEFQKWRGLEPSGRVDLPTVEAMMLPRCAQPDRVALSPWWKAPTAWQNPANLTYSISSYPRGWIHKDFEDLVRESFDTWEAACRGLSAGLNRKSGHITFDFVNDLNTILGGADLDGIAVGHAFPPPGNLPGNYPAGAIHLLNITNWSDGYAAGCFDLRLAVLHEIGHALGIIGHVNNSNCVMQETIAGSPHALCHDEAQRIGALYP